MIKNAIVITCIISKALLCSEVTGVEEKTEQFGIGVGPTLMVQYQEGGRYWGYRKDLKGNIQQ